MSRAITSLLDRVAPLNPLTCRGVRYDLLDASGAIGRYFKVGMKYKF